MFMLLTFATSVSGGSDGPLNMNMNMNPLMAATASGGLDFRSNPELLNFWMNRSSFMPGCPMPNGPNVDVSDLLLPLPNYTIPFYINTMVFFKNRTSSI